MEWEKQPGGKSFNIVSVTKSDNDSLIYIAGYYYPADVIPAEIRTINTFTGETIKIDSVETPYSYNLKMSKDGKTLVAAGGYGIGLLDPLTFNRVFWDTLPNGGGFDFNEKSMKIAVYSKSSILVYDVKNNVINKVFDKIILKSESTDFRSAKVTDDGKYIVYSAWYRVQEGTGWKDKYYIKIIDMEGKEVIKYFDTDSPIFGFTIDGKQLIYTAKDSAMFFDLSQMIVVESIAIPTGGINALVVSNDGKFLLVGASDIAFIDLDAKKSYAIGKGGTINNLILNSTNSRK